MSRKSLPDSLELLLDTMCNTFGGIMFIAISLILISQMVSKKIQRESAEEAAKHVKIDPIAMKRDIQDLELDILKMQQKLKNVLFVAESFTEAKEKARNEYLKLIDEEKLKTEEQVALARKIAELKKNNQGKERDIEKSRDVLAGRELCKKLEDKNQKAQEEINSLKDTLEKTSGRRMSFAKEENTSLEPFFLFCKDNYLYRLGNLRDMIQGEVKIIKLSAKTLRMDFIPGSGKNLNNEDYEKILRSSLRSVSRHSYFLYITTDNNSFEAALHLKRYCRKNGFKTYLMNNPMFQFTLVDKTSYSASE